MSWDAAREEEEVADAAMVEAPACVLMCCLMFAGLPRHDAVQAAGGRQVRRARVPAERHHVPATDAAATAIRARLMWVHSQPDTRSAR